MKQECYEHLRQKESTFVLIANVRDKQNWDDRRILQEYKNQTSIESKFRFFKSPVYLGPCLPGKTNRVQALGYVFILVLLIASYLEYRVRKSLKKNNQYVLLPGKKKTDRPSTLSTAIWYISRQFYTSFTQVIAHGVNILEECSDKIQVFVDQGLTAAEDAGHQFGGKPVKV
ncbi:IS4-like transposase [Thermacetogenium phaeum DSM 12270]|uniref:IS4-like transposase n=1 Tax=Thermacetogenium phaeum (strain ATCC BAA-254 / DSM 26808 / PB) TaxID=1089553 RepID=K4LE85_THEPS|nr:hypothetical protein [Thermacetogenium phaeum]AFV10387.1 IS4-like transposase [Thermacetogenium phaeum DSM 12270]